MANYDERLQNRLELQAMQIEQLMSRHGVQVEVTGGTVRNDGVNIEAQAVISNGRERLRLAARELSRVFGVDRVDLERSDGRLRLHYRKRPRNAVDLLPLLEHVPSGQALSLPLGIDQRGRPILLGLDDPEGGNVLIAGERDAGKTSLLRAIVAGTALRIRQSDVQILVICGSGERAKRSRYSLTPLEHLPHFAAPALEGYDDALEALNWLVEESAYRESSGIEKPLLLLVIDDLDGLLFAHDREPLDLLSQLLSARPQSGIRVVVGANDVISPDVRALLRHSIGLRLVGRVKDERESRAATGLPYAGAERLAGQGSFIAVSGGETIPFQAAFIDDYDLRLAIERSNRRSRRSLLALPVNELAPELPGEEEPEQEIVFRVNNGSGRVEIDEARYEVEVVSDAATGESEFAVEDEDPATLRAESEVRNRRVGESSDDDEEWADDEWGDSWGEV